MRVSEPILKTSMSGQGVLEVVLCRPTVHNAINRELSAALLAALHEATSSGDARAILLRGDGPSFCSGQDLKEPAPEDHVQRLQDTCRTLRGGPPAVAAVHGHAIGGGAELAFACDFVVASSDASFRLPEVELGLAPGGGISMFLALALGPSRAASLLLLGEELTVQAAHKAGMIHSVCEPAALPAVSRALAGTLAGGDPDAMRRAKGCLRSAWSELYETTYGSEWHAMVEAGRERWSRSSGGEEGVLAP